MKYHLIPYGWDAVDALPQSFRSFRRVRKELIVLFYIIFVSLPPVTCCAEFKPTMASESAELSQSLATLPANYEWREDLQQYVFSKKPELEAILAGRPLDDTVDTLANCLDNLSPSHTLLNGKKVSLGVVSHQALSQLVYYEAATNSENVATRWPGHILPTATAKQLRNAKRAWRPVIAKKSYIAL